MRAFYCMIVMLSAVLICCWIGTLYTTHLFPIYPDEIAGQILLARIGFDFPLQVGLLPMCKTHSPHYPFVWYFPAFVEWLLHGHIYNLKVLRMFGIGTSFLLIFSLMFKLCQKNINLMQPLYKKLLFMFVALALIVSLLEIGVVPFFLVTMRPEQLLLFCLSILLILFAMPAQTNTQKIMIVFVYYVSISILLYQHPKSLLLTPVLFIVAYRLFSRFNKYACVSLFLIWICLLIANYYALAGSLIDCHASPKVDAILKTFNVDFHNITKAPSVFFSELWRSLLDYKTDMHRIAFQGSPEINYIPSVTIDRTVNIMNKVISVNYFVIFWATFITSLILFARDLLKNKIITHNLLTVVLFLCIFASVMINKTKHWYDAGYLWSLLVMTFIFFISEYLPYLSKRKTTFVVIIYLLMVAIFSQYFFIEKYEPALNSGFAGPSVSIVDYHYGAVESELEQLASLCHIDRKKSKYLILDDLTYSYFQQSQYPLAFTYLGYGNDQVFLHGFLHKFQVDGLILRALYLSEWLQRKYAIKVGQFICVAQTNIKPLLEDMLAEH